MRLINILVVIIIFWTYIFGGDFYSLVDLEECILPISKKLYKIENGNYVEKDYNGSLYINPISISFDKNNKETERVNSKAKKILHLNKKIIISGFQVFTDNKKINSNKLVYLKDYTLLLGNYPLDDLKYMLDYCKNTSKNIEDIGVYHSLSKR